MVKVGMYTLGLSMDWADTYRPQIEGVHAFLRNQGLRSCKPYPLGETRPVWHLRLYARLDLLKALFAMEPFLIKKRDQVASAIRYLNDESTGEEL